MNNLKKGDNEKVSIIVPIYNVSKYLDNCINSLINQTYNNIEIILVNDGSTDDSLSICKKFAKKDKRIIILDKNNGGLSDARNCGLNIASGRYVCFIDGDDFIDCDMISILYNNMIKTNSQISVCGFKYYFPDKDIFVNHEYNKKDYELILDPKESIKKIVDIKSSFRMNVCNKMFDKTLFKDIYFPVGKIYEDLGTIQKLILKSNLIVYTSIPLYAYVQNPKSITKTFIFNNREINRIEMGNDFCDDILKVYGKDKEIVSIIESFRCTQYLAVVNVMIRANEFDDEIIKITKKLIKKNIINIIKYNSFKFKIQSIIFSMSSKLYINIFKKVI